MALDLAAAQIEVEADREGEDGDEDQIPGMGHRIDRKRRRHADRRQPAKDGIGDVVGEGEAREPDRCREGANHDIGHRTRHADREAHHAIKHEHGLKRGAGVAVEGEGGDAEKDARAHEEEAGADTVDQGAGDDDAEDQEQRAEAGAGERLRRGVAIELLQEGGGPAS